MSQWDQGEVDQQEEPAVAKSRRPLVWLIAMLYTVGYCALFGYGTSDNGELRLVWGFPSWVMWGIIVPWVACVLFGIWFAYAYMADDEVSMGSLPDDADPASDLQDF